MASSSLLRIMQVPKVYDHREMILRKFIVRIQSSKAAAAHLTKVMATEFALKNRSLSEASDQRAQQKQKLHCSEVNAIAPGVLPSEMINVTGMEMANKICPHPCRQSRKVSVSPAFRDKS